MKKDNWGTVIKPLFELAALDYQVPTSSGMVREVMLDNAATTIPFKAVLEEVAAFLQGYGSIHRGAGYRSQLSSQKYEEARDFIRQFVGASEQNYVVFSSNTTTAINQAAMLLSQTAGMALVFDEEHSSNLLPWIHSFGLERLVRPPIGKNDIINTVEKAFMEHPDIKIVAVTGSSNVTGKKMPIYDLAHIAHQHGASILADICQLIPHQQVDIKAYDDPQHLDFITFSGHKIYAPFGTGVLVGPKNFFDNVVPYQLGGGNLTYITPDLELLRQPKVQAHERGTPNAVGVVALGSALKVIDRIGYKSIASHEHALTKKAFDLLKNINRVRIYLDSPQGTVIPFDVDGYTAQEVSAQLRQDYGIAVRAGSFCTYELLRQLKGLSREEDAFIAEAIKKGDTAGIPTIIRASFGLVNQENDVERFYTAIKEIAGRR